RRRARLAARGHGPQAAHGRGHRRPRLRAVGPRLRAPEGAELRPERAGGRLPGPVPRGLVAALGGLLHERPDRARRHAVDDLHSRGRAERLGARRERCRPEVPVPPVLGARLHHRRHVDAAEARPLPAAALPGARAHGRLAVGSMGRAGSLARGSRSRLGLGGACPRAAFRVPGGIWGALALGLAAAVLLPPPARPDLAILVPSAPWLKLLLGAVLIGAAAAAVAGARGGRALALFAIVCVSTTLVLACETQVFVAGHNRTHDVKALTERLAARLGPGDQLVTYKLGSLSLQFYLGRTVRELQDQ